jgi:hypothetical protein
MDQENIKHILSINNNIIEIAKSEPYNFFKLKKEKYKLKKKIKETLSFYQSSGPSIPSI